MFTIKRISILALIAVTFWGCAEPQTKTQKGAIYGTGIGAAVGAGLGQAIGGDTESTLIGAGVGAVVFVRKKKPPQEVIDMAKAQEIPLMSSPYSMFVSCGRLHAGNLTGLDGNR